MKKKSNSLLPFGIFIFSLFVNLSVNSLCAQREFKEGFIVSNESDTTFGLIDSRGDVLNAKVCVFKEDENADPITYLPFEISSYHFIDSKYYVSKMIDVTRYDDTKGVDVEEQRSVFLEYLVDGIANLYYYNDNYITRYFIEDTEGQIYQLSNDEKLVDFGGKYYKRESKEYIGVLKVAMSDSEKIQSQIDYTSFERGSLIKLTKKYHNYECDDEKCVVYEKNPKRVKFRIAPFIGINYISAPILQESGITGTTNAYFSPVGGASFYWGLMKLNEKLVFILDVGLSGYKTSGEYYFTHNGAEYTSEFNYKSTVLDFCIMPQYILRTGNVHPTIAAGIFYGRHLNGKMNVHSKYDYYYEQEEATESYSKANIQGGFTAALGLNFQIQDKNILFIRFSYSYIFGPNIKVYDLQSMVKSATPLHNMLSLKTGFYF